VSTRQIHVFISHSWTYSQDYDTLETWIFKEPWSSGQASLNLRNYSVPKHNPIHNASNAEELRNAIYAQIALSHVVVIPTGMYATHSKWIQQEINGANYYRKPILAVIPRGQLRSAGVVTNSARREVGWTKEGVVGAVWELYRDS
jgi:hypothetical protein